MNVKSLTEIGTNELAEQNHSSERIMPYGTYLVVLSFGGKFAITDQSVNQIRIF
jgi:hypothetical protein